MASFLQAGLEVKGRKFLGLFSSLSESGFIPTDRVFDVIELTAEVLISFREWLHSYV